MLKNGANAIQLATNANGEPLDEKKFWPIYEVIAKSGKPILLHPARTREMPDYPTEKLLEIRDLQRARLALRDRRDAGALRVLRHHRPLSRACKIIAHHLGGVIPYLEGRVAHSFDQLGARTSDEDYGAILKSLKKRPYDYFKDFYGDTAVEGARAATICGIDFFTPDHVAVRVGLSVRQGEGAGLHPRHHQGAAIRSACRRPTRRRSATAMRSSCSGFRE